MTSVADVIKIAEGLQVDVDFENCENCFRTAARTMSRFLLFLRRDRSEVSFAKTSAMQSVNMAHKRANKQRHKIIENHELISIEIGQHEWFRPFIFL